MTISAREYFEGVRAQVRKFERVEARYAELSDTSIGAIKYDEAHGGSSDPMARIDAAMDYEQIVSERRAELEKMLDAATSILYGEHGRGGLAKLKGSIYADSICMHYLQDDSWAHIARYSEMYSAQEIRNKAMSGLRFIDRHGFAYVREGGDRV